jgi:PAS domain S-box-containing protein
MDGIVHDRTREHMLEALDARLRPLAEADGITRAAAQFLGEALQADRCAYATVDADEDAFTLVGDHVRDVPSIVGRYRFSQFGQACLRLLRAGQPFVVDDRRRDPRLEPADHAAYDATLIEGVVCVPVQKAGRFVASMAVHSVTPRTWTHDEVELVQAVASRCWESIERARLEAQARENEARWRALLEHAADIFWTAGPDGRVTQDSPSWRQFTGQTYAQWQGEGWLDAIHPEDRRWLQKAWPGAVDRARPLATEYRLRHRDGSWRWVSVRVVPIVDAAGRVREWFGMNSDITARKLAERRDAFLVLLDDATRPLTSPPQIAQTVLRMLCEELAADRATYFEIDEDGHAGTVLADYAPRLCPLRGTYPLEDYGVEFARAVRTGSTYRLNRIEDAQITPEQRRRFDAIEVGAELMVPLLKGGALKATLGLFQRTPRTWQTEEVQLLYLVVQRCWDSLERVRIEQEVRQADRRKDEFIATLAHELRNPLAPIRTGLTLLRRSGDPAIRGRTETMMERQVDHLVRMVDDLLDVSRISRGMIEIRSVEVVLQEALAHAVDAALPAIQAAQHSLERAWPREPVVVRGDPERLAQVFTNLLNNAAKFTPPHGRIRAELGQREGSALVTIEDDGAGIPPALLDEIFEMFVQGPNARAHGAGGLGIGLSLVRRLVSLHGGTVHARSEGPGKGSRFQVRLPLVASVRPRPAPAAAPVAGPLRHGRLLVVDDNRDAADATVALLQLLGWDAIGRYDGASALDLLGTTSFQLALLDLGMPGMDGFELARAIRATQRTPPVLVALTGWGQAADRAASREAGFDAHLVKPVSVASLEAVLAEHLGSTA